MRFRGFADNQALSNPAVHALAQDRFGMLWIGTEDGLNRYDGQNLRTYRRRPDDPYSLPVNFVVKLHVGGNGDLWILTADRSLTRYDWQHDRFLREPIQSEDLKQGPACLAEDRQGNLWLTGLHSLVRYDPRMQALRTFTLPTPPLDGMSAQNAGLQSLAIDQSNRIWVNYAFRLCCFHPEIEMLEVTEVRLEDSAPLLAHPNGHLYSAARIDGQIRLLEFAPDTKQVVGDYPVELQPVLPVKFYLTDIIADGEMLWMAIHGLGVGRFNTATKRFDYGVYNRADPQGLGGGEPFAILRDRSGVVWVGDARQGLSKLAPYAAYFKTYRHDPSCPDHLSLSDSYIRGMCEDRAGNIWVGTQYGGLNCLVPQSRTIRHFRHRPGDAASLAHDTVWAVLEDRQGQLWVGSLGGLQRFDPRQERFTRFPLPLDHRGQRAEVRVLFEDVDGTLWIGSGARIFALDPNRRRITEPLAQTLATLPVSNPTVEAFHRDAQGAFWVGLSDGLLRLAPDGQTVRYFREELGPSVSWPAMVCSFLTDRKGQLWLATKGMGLLRYDPAQERFWALTEREGLPHNNVYAALEDDRGWLWLSTDNGIVRYKPQTGNLRHYRPEEGLQGREFNRRAFLRTRQGIILFGGTQGLTAFAPDELEDNPVPPPIVAFAQVDEQTQLIGPGTPVLTVPWSNRFITFRLAALDFNAPQANQYAYRIIGRDAKWQTLGRQSTITLADLSPGNWIIHAKASNNDGLWNETGLLIRLYIDPPWWRTPWAYVGYALLGGGLLVGAFRLQRYRAQLLMRARIAQAKLAAQTRAKQQRAKLNRLLAHKNRELIEANERLRQLDEVKQRFTAMLVHDLKAPLASVMMLLDLLKTLLDDKLDPDVQEIMESASQSVGQTLQLIHEMLDVMRAEAGGLQLDLRATDLRTVLESALAVILPLSQNKRQTVECKLAPDLPSFKADAQKLERALVNLLSNAVKYTPEGGRICLSANVVEGTGVDRGRRFLVIEVSDTGIGIPETELSYIFDPYRQATKRHTVGAGLGLAIVRGIVAAHGGNVTVRSQVGVGTTFWVTLPLSRAALAGEREDCSDEPAAAAS
ncbi:MAG: sensor histidine kinase [Acidobacteriota bacterium]